MKILYGVQGTGNGHLSRARCMAKAFSTRDVTVDYLFSGRDKSKYFDMEAFGKAEYRHGLTFATKNHRLSRWGTLKVNRPIRFLKELSSVEYKHYDLVITDYEPVTAWSARKNGMPLLGLGHQYAFNSDAPHPKNDPISALLLRKFAPAANSIGIHWHHFNGSVLPPMVDPDLCRTPDSDDFILVYLPFANPDTAADVLQAVSETQFIFYSPKVTTETTRNNVRLKPVSKDQFKEDCCRANKIICSTGFMLISEALHIGTPVLTVPLGGQIEQLGNAMALESLGLATVIPHLSSDAVRRFSQTEHSQSPKRYPRVADAIADYCVSGKALEQDGRYKQEMVEQMWQRTGVDMKGEPGRAVACPGQIQRYSE